MIFNMKNMKFTVEVTTEPEGNHFYRLKAVQRNTMFTSQKVTMW